MNKFLTIAFVICFLFTASFASADITSDSMAGAAASVDSHDTNTAIGAPIPGNVGFGPLINYFGKPLPSSGFQPLEQLLMYGCWFTEGSLKSMLKKVEDAEAEFKVTNRGLEAAPLASEDGKTRWIKIVVQRAKYAGSNGTDFIGYVTARSENSKTTMVEVMAKAALEAMKNGCNILHLTAQGAVRDAFATGWGIGFNTTQAQMYDGDRSNVSVGGLGYSSGQAGMRDKPWLQGFGLIDRSLEYPTLRLAQKIEKQETVDKVDTINGRPQNTLTTSTIDTVKKLTKVGQTLN